MVKLNKFEVFYVYNIYMFSYQHIQAAENNLLWKSFESVVSSFFQSSVKEVIKNFFVPFINNKLILRKIKNNSPVDLNEKQFLYIINKLKFDQKQQEEINFLVFLLENLHKSNNLKEGIYVLLAGPPGTGKSQTCAYLAAKALSIYKKTEAYFVNGSDFKSEKNPAKIVKIFFDNMVKKIQSGNDIVLCIDEVDALLMPDNTKSTNRSDITSMFLTIMSEVDNLIKNKPKIGNFVLIVNTNFADTIDPALVRRFKHFITLNIPSETTRINILKNYLETNNIITILKQKFTFDTNVISNQDLEKIVHICHNLSPGEILNCINKAKQTLLYNYMKKNMYREHILLDISSLNIIFSKEPSLNEQVVKFFYKKINLLKYPWKKEDVENLLKNIINKFSLDNFDFDNNTNLIFNFLTKSIPIVKIPFKIQILLDSFIAEFEKRLHILENDEDLLNLEKLKNFSVDIPDPQPDDESLQLLKDKLKEMTQQEKELAKAHKQIAKEKKYLKKKIEAKKKQSNNTEKNAKESDNSENN